MTKRLKTNWTVKPRPKGKGSAYHNKGLLDLASMPDLDKTTIIKKADAKRLGIK